MIVNCNMFMDEITAEGVNAVRLLKSYGFLALRAGRLLRNIPGKGNYNINPEVLSSVDDMIIIFDGGITDANILRTIAKEHKDKKLIFYYWNPVRTSIHPTSIPVAYERWSYSPEDCKKYDMFYNSTFYFESLYNKNNISNIKTDICFIGKDKGRRKVLQTCKEQFENEGLTTDFYITASHPRIQKIGYKRHISYLDSIDITLESLCILDYYKDPMAGLSLRAMESIFLKRKLITNNKMIRRYDFYNPNNVFVLWDEQRSLREFIATPMAEIDSDILNNYLFNNWILRFGG